MMFLQDRHIRNKIKERDNCKSGKRWGHAAKYCQHCNKELSVIGYGLNASLMQANLKLS
jgi:hypothetical protein